MLLEAAQLKERDPYWYEAMQQIALVDGWERPEAHELLDQATGFEPYFYGYYREYAQYLLPRWNGQDDDIRTFAEEVRTRLVEPYLSMTYFEVVSVQSCYSGKKTDSLSGMSWPLIQQGYANMVRLYGTSNLKQNRFAYMDYAAHDKNIAHDMFVQIGDDWDKTIWGRKLDFETARAWAMNP